MFWAALSLFCSIGAMLNSALALRLLLFGDWIRLLAPCMFLDIMFVPASGSEEFACGSLGKISALRRCEGVASRGRSLLRLGNYVKSCEILLRVIYACFKKG